MSEFKKTGEQADSAMNSRRGFLKKAGITSLVVSLPSQSVWAGGNACTVSGNMSGNMSQNNPHYNCTLQGKSPGYYHNHLPNGFGNKTWLDIFGVGRPPFGTVADTTLVVDFLPSSGGNNPNRGPFNLNRHLMAAFFNALTGRYPLSGMDAYQYIRNLWDEIDAVGETSLAAQDIKHAITATYA